MSITVHHLDYSRSLRVLWMLEEAGLEYTIREWKRDRSFRAPAAATAIHPLGRFPMAAVDGHVLAESGAILEYFAGEHFSMADSQMFYPVEADLRRGSGARPNMRAWRDRVCGRDAYRRAEARGGPAVPPG